MSTTVGTSGRTSTPWLLLLLLFGPIGWIVLLVIAIAAPDRSERLTVEVPWTTEAHDRLRALRRRRNALWTAAVLSLVALVLLVAAPVAPVAGAARISAQLAAGALVALLVGAVVAALVAEHAIGRATVGVELDASRRWVMLTGVHPAFAAAVRSRPADAPSTYRP
ncbi:MAG TPA: hypothetical protein VFI47_13615 [Acidimicrobiales bacterium]|nr:hypothetical protein [Acidimicrobiales bacterium]